MKNTLLALALLSAAAGAVGQSRYKEYSELGSIDRIRYDSCMEAATGKPTPQGVAIATQECRRKFLQATGRPAGERVEDVLASIARDFNTKTVRPPLTSGHADAEGRTLNILYLGSFTDAEAKRMSASVHDSTQDDLCPLFEQNPVMQQGATVTVAYMTADGRAIAGTSVSPEVCRTWRQSRRR